MKFWLLKSEPDAFSYNDLENALNKGTVWDGVRNYQARNILRDDINVGDKAFFYHSSCKEPGIVGICAITETGIIDPSSLDPASKYYDPKSNPDNPKWDCVKVKYIANSKKILSLPELKILFSEDDLLVVKKGNRLSILPVRYDVAKILLEKI